MRHSNEPQPQPADEDAPLHRHFIKVRNDEDDIVSKMATVVANLQQCIANSKHQNKRSLFITKHELPNRRLIQRWFFTVVSALKELYGYEVNQDYHICRICVEEQSADFRDKRRLLLFFGINMPQEDFRNTVRDIYEESGRMAQVAVSSM